jgi:hypothetical protein
MAPDQTTAFAARSDKCKEWKVNRACINKSSMQQNTDSLKQAEISAVNKPSQAYNMFSGKLNKFRNGFSISEYKNSNITDNKHKFTVSSLFSGGLTDTISAVRCGFRPLWGADHNPNLCNMWSFLTDTRCYENVFGNSIKEAISPTYLKCKPPSDDYTRNGGRKGGDGETGWMFIRLPKLILKLQPESFMISMSDNVLNIHDGVELSGVIQTLQSS